LASLEVINDSLFSFEPGQIAGDGRAFLNFGRDLLLTDAPYSLAPQNVVIEILEDVAIDGEVLAAGDGLRERGYLLAADDVARADQMGLCSRWWISSKWIFRAASPAEQTGIIEKYGRRRKCLAEKLETQAEFETARQMGYELFQGYFFARPAIMKGQQVPGFKTNYLRILNAVHQPNLDFFELEKLIRQEPSVAYKLLRYPNSALFAQSHQIDSITRALVILGEQEVRKWASIVLLMHLAIDRFDALIRCALARASFCEGLAQLSETGGRNRSCSRWECSRCWMP
jgi:c-di-GMP-related signal transduction protein